MTNSAKVIAVAICLLSPTSIAADNKGREPANIPTIIEKGGLVLATALAHDTRYKLPPSELTPEQQSAALNHMVFRVGVIQSQAASEKHENEVTRAKYDVVAAIGVSLVGGPWTLAGATVASLGKVSANFYLDSANQEIEAKARQQVTNYIAASRQDILDDLGLESLSDVSTTYGRGAEGRAKLTDKLRAANSVFKDMRDRATAAGKPQLTNAM